MENFAVRSDIIGAISEIEAPKRTLSPWSFLFASQKAGD